MQGPESVVAAKSVIRGLSVGEPLAAVVEESADVEAGSTAGCVERVVEWRDGGEWEWGDVGALALQVLGGRSQHQRWRKCVVCASRPYSWHNCERHRRHRVHLRPP